MMMSAAEEDAKDPDWIQKLRSGGPVPLQSPEECSAGWSSPPGHNFLVRGPEYLTSKAKIPAGPYLLKPLGFDWIKSSSKVHEILRNPKGRVYAALQKATQGADGVAPFVWAFNLQIPSKENYSAIAYFVSLDPAPEGSLMSKFITGDDAYRNSRLKLIANIVNGPWIVRTAVGEQAICILGRAVSCKYHQGHNFIEVDVDIGASIIANAVVHLALGYVTSLTVDLAFLIESQNEEELPEKLLGAIRFANLDPANASSIDDLSDDNEDEFLDGEEGSSDDSFHNAEDGSSPSLPTRWWQSLSTYINGDDAKPPTTINPEDESDSSSSEEK